MIKLREWYEKYKNWVVVGLLVLFLFKSCQKSMVKRDLEWKTKQYEVALSETDSTLQAVKLRYNRTIDSLEQRNVLLLNELSYERHSAEQLKDANSKLWDANKNLSGSVRDLTKDN